MFLQLYIIPILYTTVTIFPVNCLNQMLDTKPRIVGGDSATDRANFSYQVSLRVKNKHKCGGSIITDKAILTAAHCCFNQQSFFKIPKNTMTVVFGTLKLTESNLTLPVQRVIVHWNYNRLTLANDIAIWKVKIKIEFSKYVQKIALVTSVPATDTWCRVSGWGRTRPKIGNKSVPLSNDLMYVDVTIQDKRMCMQAYRMKHMRIGKGQICASAPNKDSCQGDSGGPLVCNDKLAGIVSAGYKCGDLMGIYTNVADFIGWIERNGSLDHFVDKQFLFMIFLFVLCLRLYLS